MTIEYPLLPLPVPRVTYADHSYPAFSRRQMEEYAADNQAPLIARIDELEESLHLANGTADLAMKHRDAAETEAERKQEAA